MVLPVFCVVKNTQHMGVADPSRGVKNTIHRLECFVSHAFLLHAKHIEKGRVDADAISKSKLTLIRL